MSATVCGHGREGFCYDEATPAQRETVAFLFRSAFDWALSMSGDRERAEDYAAWLVADSWNGGDVILEGSHRTDFRRYAEKKGVKSFV